VFALIISGRRCARLLPGESLPLSACSGVHGEFRRVFSAPTFNGSGDTNPDRTDGHVAFSGVARKQKSTLFLASIVSSCTEYLGG